MKFAPPASRCWRSLPRRRVNKEAARTPAMSNQPSIARLLVDPPQPGSWNMAVDQALLEAVAERGGIVIRLYQWSEPTLSLGYFQTLAGRAEHSASRHVPVVRRASGGGAILHDRELTYSVTLPANFSVRGEASAGEAQALYRAVHESLIAALARLGVPATLCDDGCAAAHRNQQPFLCFQRYCPGDVLVAGAKIAGSAQRRFRRGVMQHGSILLSTSQDAPELPGIAELCSIDLQVEPLVEFWLPLLSSGLGVRCQRSPLNAAERTRSLALQSGRYGSVEWTALR